MRIGVVTNVRTYVHLDHVSHQITGILCYFKDDLRRRAQFQRQSPGHELSKEETIYTIVKGKTVKLKSAKS